MKSITMGDASDPYLTIKELSSENSVLRREIKEAAECGLAIVEEKQLLQQQYEELLDMYESSKDELRFAVEALNQQQKSHKKESKIGIDQEETLLRESALREAELLKDINSLQLDLKNAKNTIEQLDSEATRCRTLATEFQSNVEILENQNKKLKREKKEMKAREAKNMSEYAELEDENLVLHKQLLHLKQTLVEYESIKQENSHLKSSVGDLRFEKDELTRLKKVVESNLEELLVQLHQEREQKHALKLELEQHLSKLSMYSLQTGFGLEGIDTHDSSGFDDGEFDQDDGENPSLRRIEADHLLSSDSKNCSSRSSVIGGDLFSEIHISQVRKLEDQLEEVEAMKNELENSLICCQKQLEGAMVELQNQSNHLDEDKLITLSKGTPTEELLMLKSQISDYEKTIESLRISNGHLSPEVLQEQLTQISKDLVRVLYLAGSAVGVMSRKNSSGTAETVLDSVMEEQSSFISRQATDAETNAGDGSLKLLEVVHVQVKDVDNVVRALLKSLPLNRRSSNSSDESIEIYEEIAKLKNLLSAKKEKSTDCDSALIPMLCVHG